MTVNHMSGDGMSIYTAMAILIPNMALFFMIGKYHERWEWNNKVVPELKRQLNYLQNVESVVK